MKKIMITVIAILFGSSVSITAFYLLYGGSLLICTDNYGGEISDFDKMGCDTALLLNPFDDYIRDRRVKVLKYRHEYEKASQEYSWFILEGSLFSKVSSDEIASRYMERAIVRYMLGDKPGSIKDYQSARLMNPAAEKTIVYTSSNSYSSYSNGEDDVAFWNYIHNTNGSHPDFMRYNNLPSYREHVCKEIEDKNQKKECLNFANYMDKIQASKKSK